jgi:hypothetical protein
MKTADIEPLTTVYALRERSHSPAMPAVVIATKMFSRAHRPGEDKTLYPALSGTRPSRGRWSFETTTGMPVVVRSTYRSEATEEDLLAAAKELAATLPTGRGRAPLPTPPEGMAFELIRPQAILRPWSDYQAAEAAAAVARAEYEAARAHKAHVEQTHRRDVLDLLKRYGVPATPLRDTAGYYGKDSTRVASMGWDELHTMLVLLGAAAQAEAMNETTTTPRES